jgi:hypothetical protein
MNKTTIKTTKTKFEDLIINHIFGEYLEISKYGSVTLYYDNGEHFASWENGKGWYYTRFERMETVQVDNLISSNCTVSIGGK